MAAPAMPWIRWRISWGLPMMMPPVVMGRSSTREVVSSLIVPATNGGVACGEGDLIRVAGWWAARSRVRRARRFRRGEASDAVGAARVSPVRLL